MSRSRFISYLTIILLTGLLAACTPARHDIIYALSVTENFTPVEIVTDPFVLTALEKVGKPGTTANIYIEGDGLAWMGPNTPSLDPTPSNPVALHLAQADPAANVIYMARPCQYTKMADQTAACPQVYWTSDRFAPDIIEAMSSAMDNIKAQYGFERFNLIGFSGGGAVAALIAAGRNDIASLRTVAGNLDHATFTSLHDLSSLTGSLNAISVAPQIRNLPQYHFSGGQDEIIPPMIAERFTQDSDNPACVQHKVIEGLSHEKGWAEIWSRLLLLPVNCLN